MTALRSLMKGIGASCLLALCGSALAQGFGIGTPGPADVAPDPEPVPICAPIHENWSFDYGLRRWMPEKCFGGFGDYCAAGDITIEDLSWMPGCDGAVASLSQYSCASWTCDKPSGSAGQAQVSLTTRAVVTGRYLMLKVAGGFGFTLFDGGQVKYDVLLRITNQDGAMVKCSILNGAFGGGDFGLGCDVGVIADGIIPHGTICCDLFAPGIGAVDPGIAIGDHVSIEVIFSSTSIACDECDSASFGGVLYVDRFRFCEACLIPVPWPVDPVAFDYVRAADAQPAGAEWLDTIRTRTGTVAFDRSMHLSLQGDVNRDGAIDANDLDLLSSMIGTRADMPEFDLDDDGLVTAADVQVLLHALP